MAFEQCHYPLDAFVCNYIILLDYLIDTVNDVDLLVEKGIIRNRIGNHGMVAKIVNKLCVGVVKFGSCYYDIATQVINHYVDPESMSQNTNLEMGMSPGMWLPRTNIEHCCIYRVPNPIRRVKPEAYTPQLVIIGPLHHSLKAQARRGDITNATSMGYLNMEVRKKIYLAEFIGRVGEPNITSDQIREIIKPLESRIRESYSESTTWIKSPEFIEMILLDSIFILEFFLKFCETRESREKTGDPLIDEFCLESTIKRDLILLENQLPYMVLQSLFDTFIDRLRRDQAAPYLILKGLVNNYFQLGTIIGSNTFKHFTDLFRLIRVNTLFQDDIVRPAERPTYMYNAEKLHSGGVKLRHVGEEHSLVVNFTDDGCLEIPRLSFGSNLEVRLRNIMALEQCHYPRQAYVCNYIIFLDYLIDNEKDVDLLVEKGIIKNYIGHNGLVAETVNKLCSGVVEIGSYNYAIARRVVEHYDSKWTRCCAIFINTYWSNLWRKTATVAAVIILLMTIGQFVTSVIQTKQSFHQTVPAPANP